jgi:hypothetical protein
VLAATPLKPSKVGILGFLAPSAPDFLLQNVKKMSILEPWPRECLAR